MYERIKNKKINLTNLATIGQKISDLGVNLFEAVTKPKIKVALITYYYEKPTISGVGIHVQNLAKFLTNNNCKVHVFCSGEEEERYKEEGVVVHTIKNILTPTNDAFSKKRLEYDLFESEVVKDIIRENTKQRFDIIHTHGSLTKAAFILKKIYGIKWIHTFHAIERLRVKELSEEEKQFEDLVSWIESTVNYCDGAIFVSRSLLKECGRHYKIRSKKIIPNGVDLKLFSYFPIKKKNVLFVGRFSKEKGIELLPEIISRVMSIKNATFTLVCPHGPLDGELKKIMDTLIEQKKRFGGRIDMIEQALEQEELRNLYRTSQVYIQPSKYESFGLCLLEAMATGRPVISFNVGGVPEVITDSGFVVKNKKELILIIKRLLRNKKKATLVGIKANQNAKKFDWDLIAKRTIEYYNEVLNE